MLLNAEEERGVVGTSKLLIGVSAGSSLFLSLCMVFYFLKFQESRRCGRRILFCMHLADIGASIAWLMTLIDVDAGNNDLYESESVDIPATYTSPICYLQGYMLVFFLLSSYLWTACFAYHLYLILATRSKNPEIYEQRYHFVSWGFPLAIILHFGIQATAGFDLIGHSGQPWCWIRSWSNYEWSLDGFFMQLGFFYLPICLIFAYNISIYFSLLYKMGEVMSTKMEDRVWKRMMGYTWVFFLSAVWGMFGRFYQAISPEHELSIQMLYFTSFFTPLQGALNCLAYGMNEKMRMRVKESISSGMIYH